MVAAAIAASAVVGAGASLAASKAAGGAAKSAANTSAKAAASDQALQWKMYQRQRGDFEKAYGRGRADLTKGAADARHALLPYVQPGEAATQRVAALGGVGGAGAQLAALESDPGYQFRLQQGTQGLDRSAASRGMLLSGSQLQGLSKFNQGLASEELGNAYNRAAGVADAARGASTNLANLYQQRGAGLGNLATGQATQVGNLTSNTTNALTGISQGNTANQVQAQQALGQARGSAYTGAANAVNSAASNGLFYYGLKNNLLGGQGGGVR